MKLWMLVLAAVCVCLASAKVAKNKHHREQQNQAVDKAASDEDKAVQEPDEAEEAEEAEQTPVYEDRPEQPRITEHPCNKHHCGLGKECKLNKKDEPVCDCIKKCDKATDERFKVCTDRNVTMDSACEMDRQKCLCEKRHKDCVNLEFRNAHLDYYGPCKDMALENQKCTKYEKSQFPIRMREWLFIVMEELAKRNDLEKEAKKLIRQAEHMKKTDKKDVKHWVIPVMWKFCDLDHTKDEVIAPMEILPISAPLKPLEHCFTLFIDECDADGDENITKGEWMHCLNLDKAESEMRCDQFRSEK